MMGPLRETSIPFRNPQGGLKFILTIGVEPAQPHPRKNLIAVTRIDVIVDIGRIIMPKSQGNPFSSNASIVIFPC